MARRHFTSGSSTRRILFLLTSASVLGACSVTGGITPQEQAIQQQVDVNQYMPATRAMRDNIETQELFAQAAFWSNEYELNPTDLEATIKLAAAVRKLGNPSRAVEITQTSRQIHPRDPYLLAEHAAGLIASERALDAVPVLDQGLRIAPNYARLWSLKGAALDQMENYESARQHYARALQITPNDPNVLANLGLSHALAGDPKTAETWLRRAVAQPGAGAGVRQNLALVLQLQGKQDAAQQQTRLSQLSQGDQRFPPEPVPAFTPRGTPATMTGSTQNIAPAQASLGTQRAVPNHTQRQAMAPAPKAATGTAYQTTPPALRGQYPSARLTTVAPDGQAFTNSREAARGQVNYNTTGQQPMSRAAVPLPTTDQMTAEQAAVLEGIRQSLQPGAVGPQPQAQIPQNGSNASSQPYLVGPAPSAYGQSGYAQGGYGGTTQPNYASTAATVPARRDPARRRR